MNPTATSIVLIVINVVIWGIIQTSGFVHLQRKVISFLALSPQGQCLSESSQDHWYPDLYQSQCASYPDGQWASGVAEGGWWQILTSMFTHISLMHLAMTCLTLWFLGPPLESMIGRTRFLMTYLLAGTCGGLAVMWLSPPQSSTVGGSGSLFGLMGALLVMLLLRKSDVRQIAMWLGINIVITFTAANISWQGHLGGLVGGALLGLIWSRSTSSPRKESMPVIAVGLIFITVVAGIVLRGWMLSPI